MTTGAPKPRFLVESVVVSCADGWLVDGTDRLLMLRGADTGQVLSALVPLLDGTRTVARLVDDLPRLSREQIVAALSLLRAHGLIEDGVDTRHDRAPHETLSFFRRLRRATGVNASGHEACDKLRAAAVTIVGPREDADAEAEADHRAPREMLRALLARTGVGRVEAVEACGPDALESLDALDAVDAHRDHLIVSLCLHGEDADWHQQLDAWCRRRQRHWLRAVVDVGDSWADLGPLFTAATPCFGCFRQAQGECVSRHSAMPATAAQRPVIRNPAPGSASAIATRSGTATRSRAANRGIEATWASLVALEIVCLLTRIGPAVSEGGFRRFDPSGWNGWTSHDLGFVRVPGCPQCRPSSGDAPGTIDLAVAFEDYLSLQSSSVAEPTRAVAQPPLPLDSKRLDLFSQLPLPLPRGLTTPPSASPAGLSRAALARLLETTAGFRDASTTSAQRWSATAGNLGSVELFLSARAVDGLPAGDYFYRAREHALARIDWATPEPPPDTLADALIVLTGAFHRVARKYGPFGYRLIHLDAGVAASQLLMVAADLHLQARIVGPCADDLFEQRFDLDDMREQVTTVVACSACADPSPARLDSLLRDPLREPQREPPHEALHEPARSSVPVSSLRDVSLPSLCERLYRESRVTAAQLPWRARTLPPEPREADGRRVVRLPSSAVAERSLDEVLQSRRTVRQYAEEPIALAQIGAMLHAAHEGDANDWPAEQNAGNQLRFLVIARGIADLQPGLYRYDAIQHALCDTPTQPPLDLMPAMYIQPEFGDAPVQIWIVANLARACARHGSWGHRQLLFRAGAAAHRLWFAALRRHLAGAIVAGIRPSAARQPWSLDGYQRAALLAVTAGHAIETTPETSTIHLHL